MIAHHFPPAGGSGSNRALAFARYLPDYGWTPLVLTPGVRWAINRDDRLLAEVPAEHRVIRTRSFESRPGVTRPVLSRAASEQSSRQRKVQLARAVRSNVGHLKRFPDAHLGWLPFAVAAARRQDYDVAYSSSGPFTSHLVGLIVKRITNKPWVAELRDGWYRWNRAIFPDYPRWRDVLECRLEAAVLRTADRVVLVTDRMADAFRCQYAELPADHFAVVPNGFDGAQFDVQPQRAEPAGAKNTTFEVLHSGALYFGRSIATFLDAAHRLADSDKKFGEAFRLSLLGTLDAAAQVELARHQLGGRVQFRGQVDHTTALAAMRSADVLLLIANTTPGAEATVPGKLFEYLASGRPVLAVAPAHSSTGDVLEQTGGGWLAAADDVGGIACALQRAFSEHQAGKSQLAEPNKLARFDRRRLAGDLALVLDQARTTSDAARRD